jgi:hypothetical protein
MIGLSYGTNSRGIVIGGILTIAIADSLSDALGIHISEEANPTRTTMQVWVATVATFLSKLYSITFIIPVLLFDLPVAININLIWGCFIVNHSELLSGKIPGCQTLESNFRTFNHNHHSCSPHAFSW